MTLFELIGHPHKIQTVKRALRGVPAEGVGGNEERSDELATRGSSIAFAETRLKTCLASFFAIATGSLGRLPPTNFLELLDVPAFFDEVAAEVLVEDFFCVGCLEGFYDFFEDFDFFRV